MVLNFRKLAIPGILILLVGGTISFFLAFNYYPEKHVNVNVDGKCYELLDDSNEKYKILQAENEINTKKIQLKMIEYHDASLPVTFSGFKENTNRFIKQYNITNIISNEKVSDNPSFDKFIIKAIVSKNEFQKIVNDLTLDDFYPTLSVRGSIGLEQNQYISSGEGKIISNGAREFMENGIKEIIESNTNGIKLAECRNI